MTASIALQQQREDQKTGYGNTLTQEQASLLRDLWEALYSLEKLSIDINSSKNGIETNGTSKSKSKSKNQDSSSETSKTNSDDKYNHKGEFISALKLYSPEEIRQSLWSLTSRDDPDMILLRFLRARKWEVENAIAMLLSTVKWLLQNNISDIIKKGEEGMEKYFKEKGDKGFMKQFTSDEQNFEVLQKFTIYIMETSRLMIEPPVETGCLLFNMEGFTLSNMDFPFVKFMIQCFESYYPESLGKLIIHKAPWIFGGLWKLVSPLFDPVVAAKIYFTQSNQELLNFIPKDHLSEELGGTDKWKYEYVPYQENENYRLTDETTKKVKMGVRRSLELEFDEVNKQWIKDPHNVQIKDKRDQLKVQLRKAQLELDPYIRARTYYHRIGALKEDGSCDWVYKQ
ncbi:6131_t:CDS:2 [Diversispora eburnea]|uniref:6131_t:CDS:1 n=1 Tax=Diversispora eburnea TaxID=1213867 RepID=A0A9N8VU93_9GLOM|nr:6131_t:CDS:2 [Diversispora eburnea]